MGKSPRDERGSRSDMSRGKIRLWLGLAGDVEGKEGLDMSEPIKTYKKGAVYE